MEGGRKGGREESSRNTEASEWILAWEVKSLSDHLQKLSPFSFLLLKLTNIPCSADMIWNTALCRKQVHQAFWNYLIPMLAVTLLYGTQICRSGIHPAYPCSHFKWWKKSLYYMITVLTENCNALLKIQNTWWSPSQIKVGLPAQSEEYL